MNLLKFNVIGNSACRLAMWLSLLLFSVSSIMAQAVRKNIDVLDPTELATYEHALRIMKDRSNANPFDKTGYAWQAWVHNSLHLSYPESEEDQVKFNRKAFEAETRKWNREKPRDLRHLSDRTYYEWALKRASESQNSPEFRGIKWIDGFPGKCEHGKDLFLTWHRAQFYYFEKILQDTNPEGRLVDSEGESYPTKNLGVPFWNYTISSTGSRYPKAFEDRNSILFHQYRAWKPTVDPPAKRELFSKLLIDKWLNFGGGPTRRGVFESQLHDHIHGSYVGGGGEPIYDGFRPSMVTTTTAAYDPIFYSFHAYIDYALDAWITNNGTDQITGMTALRSEQDAKYHPPGHLIPAESDPHMGSAKLYFSSRALGYRYEVSEGSPFDSEEVTEIIASTNPSSFGKVEVSPYYTFYIQNSSVKPLASVEHVKTTSFSLDETESWPRIVKAVPDPTYITDSYQVDIYIHPEGVVADLESEAFRKKYFVSWGALWVELDLPVSSLELDITEHLENLSEIYGKGNFILLTNINQY